MRMKISRTFLGKFAENSRKFNCRGPTFLGRAGQARALAEQTRVDEERAERERKADEERSASVRLQASVRGRKDRARYKEAQRRPVRSKTVGLRHLILMRIFFEKDAQENFMHFSQKIRQNFAKI